MGGAEGFGGQAFPGAEGAGEAGVFAIAQQQGYFADRATALLQQPFGGGEAALAQELAKAGSLPRQAPRQGAQKAPAARRCPLERRRARGRFRKSDAPPPQPESGSPPSRSWPVQGGRRGSEQAGRDPGRAIVEPGSVEDDRVGRLTKKDVTAEIVGVEIVGPDPLCSK